MGGHATKAPSDKEIKTRSISMPPTTSGETVSSMSITGEKFESNPIRVASPPQAIDPKLRLIGSASAHPAPQRPGHSEADEHARTSADKAKWPTPQQPAAEKGTEKPRPEEIITDEPRPEEAITENPTLLEALADIEADFTAHKLSCAALAAQVEIGKFRYEDKDRRIARAVEMEMARELRQNEERWMGMWRAALDRFALEWEEMEEVGDSET